MSFHTYVSATHARWLADEPDRAWRSAPATMVFADVSGFTAMSERLAKRGKIGAEETTAAINRVFAGLLDATRACGGEVLKFGGDAILAYFAGEGHEVRGAAAALQMQVFMKSLRRLTTAAGTVSLRLSTGVASGESLLVLAGDQPRDMLLAGALPSAVVACESAAEAGQVIVSPQTAAALPARCLGAPAGPGVLLKSVPLVPMTDIPEIPDGIDPRRALPSHLHDHEPADGEHRFASIAFVKFTGADALAERPDDLAAALDTLMTAAGEASATHGVTLVSTDVDNDGGKVILAAGAPVASPDDEDRLLHAVKHILACDTPLRLRAGVNRGRVFAVDVGTDTRRFWSVMGDAVNLAARVMTRAEPGTLLATPSVIERLRDDFETAPVEPFRVKGKSEPVFAETIGAVRGARRVTTGRMSPLVGRESELEIIRDAMQRAFEGEQAVVELVGEAGIGKSRLVEAALAEAERFTVIHVTGGPYAAHSPYRALVAPMRELLGVDANAPEAEVEAALRRRVRAEADWLEDWLPLVGLALGLELPPTETTAAVAPEFARARINSRLGWLVRMLLAGRPALLIVEDEHWLDDASAVFLSHLGRQRRDDAGHVVLATRRDEGESLYDDLEGHFLHLQPLDIGAATAMLAGGEDGEPLPPGAAEILIERSGGNPLLLQELLAAARSGLPIDELPDSVEALVMSRIDKLDRTDRQLLLQAAVLGIRVSADLLGAALAIAREQVESTLGRLEDFLVADGPGQMRFRHALIRDAAYEALSFRRRRELHTRVAILIESRAGDQAEEQAELLAIHYHAARAWRSTWGYARLAADSAVARAAPVEAMGFLRRALEAARMLPGLPPREIAQATEKLGDAAVLAGRPDEAIKAFGQARRHLVNNPVGRAALFHKQGRVLDGHRSVSQALAAFTRGLRALEGAPQGTDVDTLQAKLVLAHGASRYRGGRLREALPYLNEAVQRAEQVNAREILAHAYFVLETVHSELGTGEARRYRGRALPIYEDLGDLNGCAAVLTNEGSAAQAEGRWDEAADLWQRGVDASRRVGDVIGAAILLGNIGDLRADQRRLDEAESLLTEALGTHRGAGFQIGIGFALWAMAGVALHRGDTAAARDLLVDARVQLEAVGAASWVLQVDARDADRLLALHEPTAALRLVGRIRERARELGAAPTLLSTLQRLAGTAKAQLGDEEGARVRFVESLELARSVEAPFQESLALKALGGLGDPVADAEGDAILAGLGVVTAVVVA